MFLIRKNIKYPMFLQIAKGNQKKYDRTSYALHGYSSSDLLITKGFRFENIGKSPLIFATIEVK